MKKSRFGKQTGRAAGVEVIDLANGRLSLRLCPTRGMSILSGRVDGRRLGWHSPVGEVVHPRHVDLDQGSGNGWLAGFSEFIVRCGLSNIGKAGWDDISLCGTKTRERLTLHGKIANLNARDVRVVKPDTKELRVEGVVRDAGLELHSTLSTHLKSGKFRITDRVTNVGHTPAEFQLLYHCNFGPPLLEKGARFHAPVRAVTGLNRRATQQISRYAEFSGPRAGFREQVFACWLRADARGRTMVALRNAAADFAISIRFSISALPCMTLWKQTGAAHEMYVTGLEPGTAFPNHRSFERAQGRVRVLAPGESWSATLAIRAHSGQSAVAALLKAIRRIQGRTQPQKLTAGKFYHLRPGSNRPNGKSSRSNTLSQCL